MIRRVCPFLIVLVAFLAGCKSDGVVAPGGGDTAPVWVGTAGVASVVPGESCVTVYWGEAVDYQDPPVEYLIYEEEDDNPFDQPPVARSGGSPYRITGLTNGVTYWFGVRCQDSAGPPHVDANDRVLTAVPYEFGWAATWGGSGDDTGNGLAIDQDENVYVVGVASLRADFDPGSGVYHSNPCSAFASKLDRGGRLLSAVTWGRMGGTDTGAVAVALDPAQGIAVVGNYEWETDFDPGPSVAMPDPGGSGCYRLRLDSGGGFVSVSVLQNAYSGSYPAWDITWWHSWEVFHYSDVEFDGDGNLYTLGQEVYGWESGYNFTTWSRYEYYSSTLRKEDASGAELWEYVKGDDGWREFAVTNEGFSYLTWGGGHILLLNPGGQSVWVEGPDYYISDVVADADGNAFVSIHRGWPDRNCGVEEYDISGNQLISLEWGGSGDDLISGIAVDPSGNIYATGSFTDTADFDPGPGVVEVEAQGAFAYYLLKLGPEGSFQWVRTWSGGSAAEPLETHVAVDGFGNPFVLGSFEGASDLDPGDGIDLRTSSGGSDIFLIKFQPDGNL